MITEDKYRQLKQTFDAATAAAERAKGALEQLQERLRSEFGCDTLEEAEKKLLKLQRKTEAAETDLDEAVKTYEQKWKD